MSGFVVGMVNNRGIIGHDGVCWQLGQNGEWSAQGGRVGGHWLDDANEVVLAILRIWDVKVEWVKDILECGEIIVAGLVHDRDEQQGSGGKDGCDFFGHHDRQLRQLASQWGQAVGQVQVDVAVR